MMLCGTHACWQNECKCARAILSYRQKKQKKTCENIEFEVFTKNSSLSPRLAIPMLHIVIKHLKVSLIVYFLRGWTFLRLLLALTVIWRARITALLTARDPDKYTELQYFSIPANIICSVLRERLGNWWGKHLMCNFIWFVHYRPSVSMLSINKRKEGITRSTSLNCFL